MKCFVVLPDVVVEIANEPQRFVARVMAPRGPQSAHWVETPALSLTDVAKLLIDWHDGPEEALWRWWKEIEPNSAVWSEGRREGRQVVTKVLVAAGDVDVEDLDGL
jgi:hypothetical protein